MSTCLHTCAKIQWCWHLVMCMTCRILFSSVAFNSKAFHIFSWHARARDRESEREKKKKERVTRQQTALHTRQPSIKETHAYTKETHDIPATCPQAMPGIQYPSGFHCPQAAAAPFQIPTVAPARWSLHQQSVPPPHPAPARSSLVLQHGVDVRCAVSCTGNKFCRCHLPIDTQSLHIGSTPRVPAATMASRRPTAPWPTLMRSAARGHFASLAFRSDTG